MASSHVKLSLSFYVILKRRFIHSVQKALIFLHSCYLLFSQIPIVNNHGILKHFLKRIILEISNLFVYCFVFI